VENRYLATDIATARPEQLVSRLLARALQSARDARTAPAGPERSRRLTRSLDILAELRNALDFAAGGEIAQNLDRLYEFAAQRLVNAGLPGAASEIDEALAAIEPIAEAYARLASGEATEARP
jgi:flagellar protein FliS